MKVECVENRIDKLAEGDRDRVSQAVHLDSVDIVAGRQYVVYGIVYMDGYPWYLVAEDEDEYPTPHFAGFFRIVDNRIPPNWGFRWRSGNFREGAILPAEWCAPFLLEAVIDGEAEAVRIYRAVKKQLDSL